MTAIKSLKINCLLVAYDSGLPTARVVGFGALTSMPVHSATPDPVQFGEFELDNAAGELRRGGTRVALPEQPFRLLEVLVEHAGQVVSRDQIRERLWAANTRWRSMARRCQCRR